MLSKEQREAIYECGSNGLWVATHGTALDDYLPKLIEECAGVSPSSLSDVDLEDAARLCVAGYHTLGMEYAQAKEKEP